MWFLRRPVTGGPWRFVSAAWIAAQFHYPTNRVRFFERLKKAASLDAGAVVELSGYQLRAVA